MSEQAMTDLGRCSCLIQSLTARQQLQSFGLATIEAVERVCRANRRPKDFDVAACASEIAFFLRTAKVSQLSRAAWAPQTQR